MIKEHEVMHCMMKNSMQYNNTILPSIKAYAIVATAEIENLINVDWKSETALSCYNAIKKIACYYLHGSDPDVEIPSDIVFNLSNKLSSLDDKHIQKLMQYLIIVKNKLNNTKPYDRLIKQLSVECLKRFFCFNTPQMFLTLDAFYQLQEYNCDYVWRALRKLGSKTQKFSGPNIVQYLFYLGMCRVPDIQMFEIECCLDEHISEITVDEIGIASRGFFMSQRRLQNKSLMTNIMKKLETNINSISSISIGAIMKLIRYSDYCHIVPLFQELLVSLRPQIPNLQLYAVTHISHAMGSLRVYDEILMDNIITRIQQDYDAARLKDIERIIYALCTVTPYRKYHDVCHELFKPIALTYNTTYSQEIQYFPKTLIRILVFLANKNIYSEELSEYVLNPQLVHSIYCNNIRNLTNELLILCCSIKIELPNYKGPQLNDNIYNFIFLCKVHLQKHIKEILQMTKIINSLNLLQQEKLKIDVHTSHILPHYYSPEIIICFDKDNKLVPVKPILSDMPNGTIKRVDTDDLQNIKWKILFLLSSKCEVLGQNGYIGSMYQKFRHLKAIGYTPIAVICFGLRMINNN
ncbi:FAST kinase domain-containing protein 5 [Dufourea novaeangliae]|uniref:FAST kinase domain-containing protein 5 n=1 Tax=Dufourea novaeangliae TaxID=178035 RepID=A0A154PIU5_DUFNO|nr:FAST kinase domain-containing protein 5 [Dufourea novaeangliae]